MLIVKIHLVVLMVTTLMALKTYGEINYKMNHFLLFFLYIWSSAPFSLSRALFILDYRQ